MSGEERLFLRILGETIRSEDFSEEALAADGFDLHELDWDALTEIAVRHQMAPVLYEHCEAYLSGREDLAPVRKRLRDNRDYAFFCYMQNQEYYAQVSDALQQEGIRFIPVKGIVIAERYEKPYTRTMGDIDLVMSGRDRDKAHALMLRLGYRSDVHADHEWGYQKGETYFELHEHLLHNETVNPKEYRDWCDRCFSFARETGGGTALTLDSGFHFIYLLMHLRKHLMNAGAGFRMFYDIALMADKTGSDAAAADWDWINKELEELELLPFAQTVLALCGRWFGIATPLGGAQLEEDFISFATGKVLEDGVFGLDNTVDPSRLLQNDLQAMGNLPSVLRAPVYLLKRVFMPYSKMRVLPRYAYLDKRPYLLPAAWVQRGVHVIRDRRILLKRMVSGSFRMTEEELRNAQEEFRRWGL